MRVLGIDPGIATTGYAVVERGPRGAPAAITYGAIRTPGEEPHAVRLARLGTAVADVIDGFAPDSLAMERLFFNLNVRTAMAVGQASGVVMAAAADRGLEVFDYTPPEVKLSVTGTGGATKRQVQAMVASLLSLPAPPEPVDAADACALAICHLNRAGLRRAVGEALGVGS